jgi:hypothetical protein
MKPTDPPRPTGRPPREYGIYGLLLLWREEQPVLVQIVNGPLALALFTSDAALKTAAAAFHLTYDRIKAVDDPDEFIRSLPPDVTVILDPHVSVRGTVVYRQAAWS